MTARLGAAVFADRQAAAGGHPIAPGLAPHCKLTGHDLYGIRGGVDRVVSEVHDRELVIVVMKVGHRRDVYRS